MRKLRTVDLFCGACGASLGAHQTGAVELRLGIDAWDVAIRTHADNFSGDSS